MTAREINFDGLIGPSHNYAGLSLGNLASKKHAGGISRPRAAALQGLKKMRLLMELGLTQGFFPPHPRPNLNLLRHYGFSGTPEQMVTACARADSALLANVYSASPMWTANAATVSPSADTNDVRVHFTTANLATMLHRSNEADFTTRILRTAFANEKHFTVHEALRGGIHFGDEGAANHGRLCRNHDARGLELFVYGTGGSTKFPARQMRRASEAVARRHELAENSVMFVPQAVRAIDAGAFHNDVVSVANGNVLFAHEFAFENAGEIYARLRATFPDVKIVEVKNTEVPLEDAIASYLFNSQLLTLSDGTMALVLPIECSENPRVANYLKRLLAQDTPIRAAHFIDVRESMKNGGGPACLRLRVAVTDAEYAAIDARFLLTPEKISRLEAAISEFYPEHISADNLADPQLLQQCRTALEKLADAAQLRDLYGF